MQLAAAMAYMHERGVIHGDLSRANILLADSEDSPSGFDVKVPTAVCLPKFAACIWCRGARPSGARSRCQVSGVRAAARSWRQTHT